MKFRGLALLAVAACASHARAPVAANHVAAPATTGGVPAAYPDDVQVHLTPELVLSTIRDHYLSGVERCYSRHAKLHGSANGRVLVSFTVDADGKTRDGNAHGIATRVDRCITAQVARWTFPAPQRESAFALGLQLSTD